MYFEDIFFKTVEYWKSYFFLDRENINKIVFKIHEEIDSKIDNDDSIFDKDVYKLMNWSISVVVGDYLNETSESFFNLDSIKLGEFEGRFKHDLNADSWEKEKEKYKGFKDPLINKEP